MRWQSCWDTCLSPVAMSSVGKFWKQLLKEPEAICDWDCFFKIWYELLYWDLRLENYFTVEECQRYFKARQKNIDVWRNSLETNGPMAGWIWNTSMKWRDLWDSARATRFWATAVLLSPRNFPAADTDHRDWLEEPAGHIEKLLETAKNYQSRFAGFHDTVDHWNPANHLGCMKPYK